MQALLHRVHFILADGFARGDELAVEVGEADEVLSLIHISMCIRDKLCEATKDFKVIRMGNRCLRIHKESFDKWFDNMCGIQ